MKRILSFVLLAVLLLTFLSACGESQSAPTDSSASQSDGSGTTSSVTDSEVKTDTATDTDTKATSSKQEEEEKVLTREPGPETNLVMATDQVRRRLIVYDLSACTGQDLDKCAVWMHTAESGYNFAGLKFREDTVFGDVVLGIGGQYAVMVSYPEGNVLWKTTAAGNNGHCIEILPGGNVVTAATTGNTLTLFNVSARLSNPHAQVTRKVYELEDAHGVLWDPEYNVLWALGINELRAYNVVGEGAEMELVLNEDLSATLPSQGGHAIGADFTDKDYLWLSTWNTVYRFNKKDGTFSFKYDDSAILNRANVKGFGNNPLGSFMYTYPNGGPGRSWASLSIAEWCTDTILFAYTNESGQRKLRSCVSQVSAFYKVVPFYGQYQ